MYEILLDNLKDILSSYDNLRNSHKLEPGIPEKFRNLSMTVIIGRMEALSDQNKENDTEFKLCRFLIKALNNGWLTSDIRFLINIFDVIHRCQGEILKSKGMDILDQIMLKKIDTVEKRFTMLDIISEYFKSNTFLGISELIVNSFWGSATKVLPIFREEYPEDTHFDDFSADVEGIRIAGFQYLPNENAYKKNLEKKRRAEAKEKTTYVRREITRQEIINNELGHFAQNKALEHNRIIKTHKQVICEVFGEEVYDEIDEMSIGSHEDRTVPIFHSQGTKLAREGHEVIEMYFAGSGSTDVPNYHKGRSWEIDLTGLSDEEIREKYGEKVRKSETKYFDYIYKQDKLITTNNNTQVRKVKYTFGGPNPSFYGIFNLGDYSIESSRENALRFVKEILEPRFNNWLNGSEQKHAIYIVNFGHSRGAVSAEQSIEYINNWITKYINDHRNNPRAEDLKDYIHYDLRAVDSVPGAVTNLRLGTGHLKGIPNVEATAICSMGQEHTDILFPLQYLQGVKRIILTNTDHFTNVDSVDASQENIFDDGLKHAGAYYDAETGEMYRRSGINQMPEGVYVSDEDRNLVRVTSFSQMSSLFKSYCGTAKPQRIRYKNILKMVRDWFVDNDLKMSFIDETTRVAETKINLITENRILNSPNTRLNRIKNELRTLIQMRREDASKSQLIEQQEILIRECRQYMLKTTLPPKSDDSSYRINLVSDLLSYTMRERNTLAKELSAEFNLNRRFELDEKIEAFRNRLKNKEGYLQRKRVKEDQRLHEQKDTIKKVKNIAKACKTQLTHLKNTSYLLGNSDSYVDYYNTLIDGTKLSDKSSPKEITDFLIRLTEVSDEYVYSHDKIIGPIFGDGKTRLNSAKHMATFSKRYGKEMEKRLRYYGDRNLPIGKKLEKTKLNTIQLNADYAKYEDSREPEPIPKIPKTGQKLNAAPPKKLSGK